MSEQLSNTYRSFASEQERDGISRRLQETEDWLYEDGDDETELAYSLKLEDLKKVIFPSLIFMNTLPYCLFTYSIFFQLVDPIENRYKDDEARTQATRDLLKCIKDHRASAGTLPVQDKELVQILGQ